jgi:hypothetical protein
MTASCYHVHNYFDEIFLPAAAYCSRLMGISQCSFQLGDLPKMLLLDFLIGML